ncbi:MAG: hypothetical protein ACLTW9_23535 [Enterocloster sp.]
MENGEYTGHILMDSILAVELGTARSQGIYVEAEGDRLPEAWRSMTPISLRFDESSG